MQLREGFFCKVYFQIYTVTWNLDYNVFFFRIYTVTWILDYIFFQGLHSFLKPRQQCFFFRIYTITWSLDYNVIFSGSTQLPKVFTTTFFSGSTQIPEVLTTMFCSGSTQLPEMPGSGLLQEGGYISRQGGSQSLLILYMLAFCGLSLEFYTNWNSLYCMCSILFVTTCVTRISSNLKHHFFTIHMYSVFCFSPATRKRSWRTWASHSIQWYGNIQTYERLRQWPVTDIGGWPLVNETSWNKNWIAF